MREQRKRMFFLAALIFYPFAVFFALKAAPYITEEGPAHLLDGLAYEMERPFTLPPAGPEKIIKTLAVVTAVYFLIAAAAADCIRNRRYGEEQGSARWADARTLNRKFKTKKKVYPDLPMWRQDTILTRQARMGFDFYRPSHQKNLNTLIWGGPGTWKTRGYIGPNIMQMNSNYIITDPKGELAKKFGGMLQQFGYRVLVFDISNPNKSCCFNPFRYFRDDKDVLQFVTNFFASTEDKKAQKGDKFWDDQAKNLMLAFCYLLFYEAPEDEQNLPMVNELLLAADVSDSKDDCISAVDIIFSKLEKKDPKHPALTYYKSYHKGSGKTLQSIQATLSARMSYFNIEALSKLTYTDDIDIRRLATEKTALFAVIPDSDASLNFLVGTLYQQMFQQLYDLADNVYDGPLPIHQRFLMDEFANIALPDDYQKILSTARSRNISFAIVLQDKSQIESLFEDLHKTIMANCSSWLFLGSNEKETCEYISALVGKETVAVRSTSRTYGRMAGYSVQEQVQQRDLITPDEVRRKAQHIAILIIEGEDALRDTKYNMKTHRYYKYVAEGENLKRKKEPALIYDWGSTELATGTFGVVTGYAGRTVDIDDLCPDVPKNKVLTGDEVLAIYAA